MESSTSNHEWLPIGIDEDGSSVYIVPSAVVAYGVGRDEVSVTLISLPERGSEGFHALQEMASQAGAPSGDVSYAEQSWGVALSRRTFAVRNIVVRGAEGSALYSATYATTEWREIAPGSIADKVLETLVGIVNPMSTNGTWQVESPLDPDGTPPTRPVAPGREYEEASSAGGQSPAVETRISERPRFRGSGSQLFGIQIVNLFLTIVTFGIYSFWGKVRVRKFVWGNTDFGGDTFAFHGTGKEILRGYSRAFLVFGLPLLMLSFLDRFRIIGPGPGMLGRILGYAIIVVAIAVATVGARRYRLSRTSWRGIRFSFRGRVFDYVKIFIGGMLFSLVTLGLYWPFFDTRRQAFLTSNTFFGNQQFAFDGKGRALFGPFLVAVLLTLPTVGLCWFWYVANKRRYFWAHTRFGGLRFRATVTGGQIMRLYLGNWALTLITLSLGRSWAVVRTVRLICRYLEVEGSMDVDRIQQEAQNASTTGEGLADFMDGDFGLG